jgi:flagellin-like protein
MKKGISPLIATVLLIALTLVVGGLLGSWLTSMSKTQTGTIEEAAKTQINCTSAFLDIVDVICSNSTQKLQVVITNLGDIELYGFSVLATIDNTFYQNSTGGPNSTHPLSPGEQAVLTYYCNNTEYCVGGRKVQSVRVTPSNCPQSYAEKTFSKVC